MENYTFRLTPGQDLFGSIQAFVERKGRVAGCILSGEGSLTHAELRIANRHGFTGHAGPFEIVSIIGTVSIHESHMDLSITNRDAWSRPRRKSCLTPSTMLCINASIPRTRVTMN